MIQFYDTYSDPNFANLVSSLNLPTKFVPFQMVQTHDKEMLPFNENKTVPFKMAQFPNILNLINWTCHLELLSCKFNEERIFYMLYAHKQNLMVKELRRAIKTNAYAQLLSEKDNLSVGLEQAYPDAKYLFKDVAYLDFLGLPKRHSEKQLRKGLVAQMKEFIIELGKDLIFMGEEYPLTVGDSVFKIDLLFYHRGLQCLVAIELKNTKFIPEYMGQLEFYLEALDQDVKRSNENPSIGILLCKESNKEIVRYAMNRSMSPTMVAKYERELIPIEVLQRSLTEFCNFIKDN